MRLRYKILGGFAAILVIGATYLAYNNTTKTTPNEPIPPVVESIKLSDRLKDVNAELIKSVTDPNIYILNEPNLLNRAVSLLGSVETTVPTGAVILEINYVDGTQGHCNGQAYRQGIISARHCIDGDWSSVVAYYQPTDRNDRSSPIVSYGFAVGHTFYEGCGPGEPLCRWDYLWFPTQDILDVPLSLPQTEQTTLEVGESVRVVGTGYWEGGLLSETWREVILPVKEVKPTIIELDGLYQRFGQGWSGGPAYRASTGTQVGITSHYHGGGFENEQFIIPLNPSWICSVHRAYYDKTSANCF